MGRVHGFAAPTKVNHGGGKLQFDSIRNHEKSHIDSYYGTKMSTSTSVFYNERFRNQKATYLVESESTESQSDTELECQRFFIDLNKVPKSQLDHLGQTGLLLLSQPDQSQDEQLPNDTGNDSVDRNHCVLLLRSKHMHFLSQVWQTSPSKHNRRPLNQGFVSLDASRPWILYWCLHGYDLLGRQGESPNVGNNDTPIAFLDSSIQNTDQEESYVRMIRTLETCWQSRHVTLSDHICTEWLDQDPLVPNPVGFDRDGSYEVEEHAEDSYMEEDGQERRVYEAGGFGGGPGQMAHAATTYAGILALCIIATTSHSSRASNMAWDLLQKIRPSVYMWMLSLQQPDGSYRMHWDGEVDVRASYTILCCAKLLNILDMRTSAVDTGAATANDEMSDADDVDPLSATQQKQRRQTMSKLLLLGGPDELVVSYLVRCQTYEGGIGGEPYVEAHGGYTFCGVAALKLIHRLHKLDVDSLLGWLSRRQMPYEGGFSGRSNKLVDACYSFWQAGALALTSQEVSSSTIQNANYEGDCDPWLACFAESQSIPADTTGIATTGELLMDAPMLERYILLCAQDVSGGLRDKPSKQRDFYHTCYSLSGLSIIQHYGSDNDATKTSTTSESGGDSGTAACPDWFGHRSSNWVRQTHPCYNIRIERVQHVLDHFRNLDDNDKTVPLKMMKKMLPLKT